MLRSIFPKFSGSCIIFSLFFLALFLGGGVGNTYAAVTSVPSTTTETAEEKVKSAAKKQATQNLKDCIAAQAGGKLNPVDVCYAGVEREHRTADLTTWADFSEQRSVGSLFQKILGFFMAIVGGLALLAIMIGGGMIMLGGTDETMLERGKDILKYTAIGVAIVLLAVTITTLVQTFFYSVDV